MSSAPILRAFRAALSGDTSRLTARERERYPNIADPCSDLWNARSGRRTSVKALHSPLARTRLDLHHAFGKLPACAPLVPTMTDDRQRIAAAIKDYPGPREDLRGEQFAFKTKLGKSTIDKLLIGLFSDRTLSIVESHTNLRSADALLDSRGRPTPGERSPGAKPQAARRTVRSRLCPSPISAATTGARSSFADGIVEDIITALSRMRNYFVIARNSSFTYKGRADRRPPGRPRARRPVCHRGRRASTRRQSHSRDRPADRGLIRRACLGGKVRSPPRRSCSMSRMKSSAASRHPRRPKFCFIGDGSPHKPPRPDITTWELAKKAWMAAYGFSRDGHETAIALAKLAVARDPVNALGYEVLASVQMHFAYMGFAAEPEVLAQEAFANIRRALELGGASEYSHWVHGTIIGFLFGRHEQACTALRQAIDLNPNFSLGYGTLGTMLVLVGKPDEGIRNTEFAIRLNPRDPGVFFRYSGLSLAYLVKRDLPAALEWAERSASRNPDWWLAHALIAAVQSMQGALERLDCAGCLTCDGSCQPPP